MSKKQDQHFLVLFFAGTLKRNRTADFAVRGRRINLFTIRAKFKNNANISQSKIKSKKNIMVVYFLKYTNVQKIDKNGFMELNIFIN